jgi:hypothetical protein
MGPGETPLGRGHTLSSAPGAGALRSRRHHGDAAHALDQTPRRELGRNRDLLAAVLARLEDEAMLSDRRLQASLDEMRQGRKVYRRRRAQ